MCAPGVRRGTLSRPKVCGMRDFIQAVPGLVPLACATGRFRRLWGPVMLRARSSPPIAFTAARSTIMVTGLRLVILVLLVATIGLPGRADARQARPAPSGDPVPAPGPSPEPQPEPDPPPDGGDPPDEPGPEPPPPAEFIEIGGHERLAWTQAAPSDEALAALRFTVYVDSEARELADVSCASAPSADGYECSSPVPA